MRVLDLRTHGFCANVKIDRRSKKVKKRGREGGVVSVFTTFVQGLQDYYSPRKVKNAPFLYIWSFFGIIFHLDRSIYQSPLIPRETGSGIDFTKERYWVKDIISIIPSCLFFWICKNFVVKLEMPRLTGLFFPLWVLRKTFNCCIRVFLISSHNLLIIR